jgi:hypothetical protein
MYVGTLPPQPLRKGGEQYRLLRENNPNSKILFPHRERTIQAHEMHLRPIQTQILLSPQMTQMA